MMPTRAKNYDVTHLKCVCVLFFFVQKNWNTHSNFGFCVKHEEKKALKLIVDGKCYTFILYYEIIYVPIFHYCCCCPRVDYFVFFFFVFEDKFQNKKQKQHKQEINMRLITYGYRIFKIKMIYSEYKTPNKTKWSETL